MYIIDTQTRGNKWHANRQTKTRFQLSKWAYAFIRVARNETLFIHHSCSARVVLSPYYNTLLYHWTNRVSKEGGIMKKYLLYIKNEKGIYEETAIGYFNDLLPLSFGRTARFECLGK